MPQFRHLARRILLSALLPLAAACSPKEGTPGAADAPEARSTQAMLAAPRAAGMPAVQAKLNDLAAPAQLDEAPLRRYVAIRHELNILTEAQAVESAWQQANEACIAAGCEVLASVISRDEQRRPSSASLQARVPPPALEAFLARVTALGSVGQHARTADDRTDDVIDTDARLKNMSAFRDRLRALMATPGARLKDVIEVERELVRVQSDLDSLTARRKALAQQTDRVSVTLNFQARPSVLETGIWVPVRETIVGAGRLFAESVAKIITLLVFVLPWILVCVPAGLLGRFAWRRFRGGS
jgi:Domain of unknown function (DUF4349)